MAAAAAVSHLAGRAAPGKVAGARLFLARASVIMRVAPCAKRSSSANRLNIEVSAMAAPYAVHQRQRPSAMAMMRSWVAMTANMVTSP